MSLGTQLFNFWYFLIISDDLMLLLCCFAIWKRNQVKRIRLFQLLVPLLLGVVGYSLERTLFPLWLNITVEQRKAILGILSASPVYVALTIGARTFRSFFAWRFVLYALGITNGNSAHLGSHG